MPRTIRFHLDEHCPFAIARGLRAHGVEASTTPDAGLLGAPDEDQLAYCRTEGRVIITNDTDFLKLNAAGEAHPGIVFYPQGGRTIGHVIREVVLLWEVYELAEMANRVEYL